MDPVMDKLASGCPPALGQLIFMVGKGQVLAAAMDVKNIAKIFAAHG